MHIEITRFIIFIEVSILKRFFLFNLIVCCFLLIFSPKAVKVDASEEASLTLNSSYCVLIEPKSRHIIYQSNPNEKLYPASMTKMMGMLLVLEEINKGKISWDDEVICSSYASSMGGTQIYLEEGEKMKLEDLFKSVAINSANDAIVCLGEYVAGSNDEFVKRMNQKAKELKMVNTSFKNATGFDDPEHYTCPLDMANLACELLKYEKDVLKFSSLKEAYVRENTSKPFWLVNTNKLLGAYEGMDGLKTGFTSDAGYNLTATAKRNGLRLVSVVMHEETIKKRSQDTVQLLNYGFSKLKSENLFSKDDVIDSITLTSSLKTKINVIVKEDINIVMNKEENKDELKVEMVIDKYYPPIKEDEVIGKLKITTKSGVLYEYDLYSDKVVDKPSFWDVLLRNIQIFFS